MKKLENMSVEFNNVLKTYDFDFAFTYHLGVNEKCEPTFAVKITVEDFEDCEWVVNQAKDGSQMILCLTVDFVPNQIMDIARVLRSANENDKFEFIWDYYEEVSAIKGVNGTGRKTIMS